MRRKAVVGGGLLAALVVVAIVGFRALTAVPPPQPGERGGEGAATESHLAGRPGAAPADRPGTGRLLGIVVDAATQEGIPASRIHLVPRSWDGIRQMPAGQPEGGTGAVRPSWRLARIPGEGDGIPSATADAGGKFEFPFGGEPSVLLAEAEGYAEGCLEVEGALRYGRVELGRGLLLEGRIDAGSTPGAELQGLPLVFSDPAGRGAWPARVTGEGTYAATVGSSRVRAFLPAAPFLLAAPDEVLTAPSRGGTVRVLRNPRLEVVLEDEAAAGTLRVAVANGDSMRGWAFFRPVLPSGLLIDGGAGETASLLAMASPTLFAVARGCAHASAPIDPRRLLNSEIGEIRVVLRPAAANLTGRVEGLSVDAVAVHPRRSGIWRLEALGDPLVRAPVVAGAFEASVPPGDYLVTAPGAVPAPCNVPSDGAIVVGARAAARLRVQVVRDGARVARAGVVAVHRDLSQLVSGRTSESGVVEFGLLPEGNWAVGARGPEEPTPVEWQWTLGLGRGVRLAAGRSEEVVLDLAARASARPCEVVLSAADGISDGLRIRSRVGRDPEWQVVRGGAATTLEYRRGVQFEVQSSAGELWLWQAPQVEDPGTVAIEIPAGTMSGVVLRGGSPAGFVRVSASPIGGPRRGPGAAYAPVDASGRWRLRGLEGGLRYRLSFEEPPGPFGTGFEPRAAVGASDGDVRVDFADSLFGELRPVRVRVLPGTGEARAPDSVRFRLYAVRRTPSGDYVALADPSAPVVSLVPNREADLRAAAADSYRARVSYAPEGAMRDVDRDVECDIRGGYLEVQLP